MLQNLFRLLVLDYTAKSQSDIFIRCQEIGKNEIYPEVTRYEDEGNLDTEKKQALTEIFRLMVKFRQIIKTPTFLQRLDNYVVKSQQSEATLKDLLKKELLNTGEKPKFIPFKDPLLSFDHIRNTIFEFGISLAIDPNILLNVVIANADIYNKEDDLDVIVESIKKWKIKEAWNLSIGQIKES